MFCFSCMRQIENESEACPHCGSSNADCVQKQPEYVLHCGESLHGRYLIGRMLGQGGFGITYIGYDCALERRVCIKEYFPTGAAMRSSAQSMTVLWSGGENATILKNSRDSFVREARKTVRLNELKSVVSVMDVFYENDTAYIIMEYIEGVTLSEHLKKLQRPLTPVESFALLRPVMMDLGKAHAMKIIHRDISPDNLMLKEDQSVTLLDLGAAKDLSDHEGHSTKLVAKRGFSPLEQYSEHGAPGPAMDIYAMCATFYYCVTGKVLITPFERLNGGSVDFSMFTPAVRTVMEKGLAIKAEDRFQSMEELVSELERAFTKDEEKKPDKPKIIWLLLAAILFAGIALLIVYLKKGSQEPVSDAAEHEVAIETTMPIETAVPTESPEPSESPAPTASPTPTPSQQEAEEAFRKGKELESAGDYTGAMEAFQTAAEAGSTSAMVAIGDLYFYGHGVEQDQSAALAWYQKAAELGDGDAISQLGLIYVLGEGVPQDPEKAFYWFSLGAESGNAMSMKNIGVMYYSGNGVEKDYAQAQQWFRRASQKGNSAAMCNLGIMYFNGDGVERDYEEAMRWFRLAEEAGNPTAIDYIGLMYYFGRGVAQSDDTAMDYFTRAAEMGNAMATNNIGMMYQNGRGVEQDFTVAGSYYLAAADKGYAKAMNNLGFLYAYGLGVQKDRATAMQWYQAAVNTNGNSAAMCNIGNLYIEQGRYAEAMDWYLRAAEQGNAIAMTEIGTLCYLGNGVEQNYGKAAEWFLKGAEAGDAYGYYGLGVVCFDQGNYDEAKVWYELAAEQNIAEALQDLAYMYQNGLGVEQNQQKADAYAWAAERIRQEELVVGNTLVISDTLDIFDYRE